MEVEREIRPKVVQKGNAALVPRFCCALLPSATLRYHPADAADSVLLPDCESCLPLSVTANRVLRADFESALGGVEFLRRGGLLEEEHLRLVVVVLEQREIRRGPGFVQAHVAGRAGVVHIPGAGHAFGKSDRRVCHSSVSGKGSRCGRAVSRAGAAPGQGG